VGADAITGTPSGTVSTEGSVTASGGNVEGESPTATSFTIDGTTLFDPSGTPLLVVSPSQSFDLFAPREKLRGVGSSLVSAGVLAGMGSGVSSKSLSNVSLSQSRDYLSGVTSSGSSPASVAAEPSMLLLLACGLALAARRLTRSHRQATPH
jgi:hypothetical protein